MSSFKKLCEPAKLYLVVSAIFLVLAIFQRISALTLITKGVFVLIWTMVLNWLCSKGFKGLAWIIVLLPFLFLFMAMFTTMDMMGMIYDGFQAEPRVNRAAASARASGENITQSSAPVVPPPEQPLPPGTD
jgi:hypothetical protein